MRNYKLDEKDLYVCRTSTKGTQAKYERNGYFYKVNSIGNEGLTEHIVSRFIRCTDIPERLQVYYEYCSINGKLGCRSKNFLRDNESFVSMETLYNRLTGYTNLANRLMSLSSSKDRLIYLIEMANTVNVPNFDWYLKALMQIDLVIQNVDRHTHNFGVVFNARNGRYRIPPIFDNGMSLNTDCGAIPKVSCTLSGSFEEQVVAFGYPVSKAFSVDFSKLSIELNNMIKEYGYTRELQTLHDRIKVYGDIFK